MINLQALEENTERAIDGLFTEVSDEHNLSTGDIDPLDSFALDRIKQQIVAILVNYIKGNSPDNI